MVLNYYSSIGLISENSSHPPLAPKIKTLNDKNPEISDSSPSSPSSCYPRVGLRPLKFQSEIPHLLEEFKFKSGVEVGVQQGKHSEYLLKVWKSCESFKLVDIWTHQENNNDKDNHDNSTHQRFYEDTMKKMEPYKEKIKVYRMYSTEAAKLIEKESLDFAFIDARHDYCGVTEDLEAYWPLIKPGGIMAGHDYHSNDELIYGYDWGLCADGSRHDSAVKGAVNDFFLPKGLTITLAYGEKMWFTWLVQKPLC